MFPQTTTHLQAAVDHLNSQDPSARQFVMETIYTQDNDSFGAMDESRD